MQKISISFISENLRDELCSLKHGKNEDKNLYILINRAFRDIENDLSCCTKIPSRLWKKLYKKFNLTNLWKYDLSNGWRIIFTLKQDEIMVVALILEWFSHKEYNRRFKY